MIPRAATVTFEDPHVLFNGIVCNNACENVHARCIRMRLSSVEHLLVEHRCRRNAYPFVSGNNVTASARDLRVRGAPAITIVAAAARKHQKRPRVIRYYRAAFPLLLHLRLYPEAFQPIAAHCYEKRIYHCIHATSPSCISRACSTFSYGLPETIIIFAHKRAFLSSSSKERKRENKIVPISFSPAAPVNKEGQGGE